MLDVVRRIGLADVAFLVLEAHGRSWYPGRFWDPLPEHEPWLAWSLEAYDHAVARVTAAGVPLERLVVGGFSQGACITAEYVARTPASYGGVAILTGTLMGPEVEARPVEAPLVGVRVFLGTSSVDEWIPVDAVQETARWFARAGASVTLRVYDDREHNVNHDEVAAVRGLLEARLGQD